MGKLERKKALVDRIGPYCLRCSEPMDPATYGLFATESSNETNPDGGWEKDKRVVLEVSWRCLRCPESCMTEHYIAPKNADKYVNTLFPKAAYETHPEVA